MALLFRSRLRFSSSKITPVLSGSEAHDRIVYSVREGSAVSSHPLVIPSQPQSLPCWGMINIPQGCGCCSLVATCQLSAEGQLCPFNSLGANQEVGAVWALQTPGSVALSHFCRCLAPCHWLLWNPSSRSRRSCWKQSPAKLLKARKTLCRKKWMGWAQWSREHIQTLTQVSSALLLVLEFLSLDTTAAPTSAGSAWNVLLDLLSCLLHLDWRESKWGFPVLLGDCSGHCWWWEKIGFWLSCVTADLHLGVLGRVTVQRSFFAA